MPRYRRRTVRGALVHLISRVTDGEFRIDDDARIDYLRRIAKISPRVRWLILAYALMSNHVHWALLCLGVPLRELFHPLHTGFGGRLNMRDNRHTPVFFERPWTWNYEPQAAKQLIAYIHNNPVRANVVAAPDESWWTSHRAYIGLEPPPPWLDVNTGLELSGFDATPDGRDQFHAHVMALKDEPRDPLYSCAPTNRDRRLIRRALNAPVELATPALTEHGVSLPVEAIAGTPIRERWPGSPGELLFVVSNATGVPVARMRSRTRAAAVVRARCLLVTVGVDHLGLAVQEVAAIVGLGASAGSKLLTRNPGRRQELAPIAEALGEKLWRGYPRPDTSSL